ncbi:MAG: hypothetical protein F4Z82_10470 [Caldilineaceae bacterium SB0668_bin_21]|nr:hypothetical protein [Caldilineaceae bacterium SB0668_bin_21]MYC21144.1 hypothetical protein [Caldilineaceae bacterium SB0662_bin_25]
MKSIVQFLEKLLRRALQPARVSDRSSRAVIEDGLRILHATPESHRSYRLPDLSVGDPGAPDPLAAYSWQELRETIYPEREWQ